MVNAVALRAGDDVRRVLRFIASPANLAREGSAAPRRDWSDFLRQAYDAARIPPAHTEAWRWLVAQPGGPAKVLATLGRVVVGLPARHSRRGPPGRHGRPRAAHLHPRRPDDGPRPASRSRTRRTPI